MHWGYVGFIGGVNACWIRHSGFIVSDIGVSRHFYEEILGFEVIQAFEDNSSYINDITRNVWRQCHNGKNEKPGWRVLLKYCRMAGKWHRQSSQKFQFIMLERPILLFRCLILMRITTCFRLQKTFPFYQGRLFLQRGSQRYFCA